MKTRHKKLIFIGIAVIGLGVVSALVLNAFRSNLVFFFTPTQIVKGEAPLDRAFRVGGLVESGSLRREPDGVTAHFRVTDKAQTIQVTYTGLLPDLFKEGKGVVAQGRWNNSVFVADQVLAKHDENYMPPEAASALEQAAKAQKTLVPPQEGKL